MATSDTQTRILLVEDDTALAELTSTYLRKNGYCVDIAGTGHEAIEKIRADEPDLVLLDIMIPGMDGLDVCRNVRPDYKKPILFLTARTDDIDQIIGLEMGADDYVCKPVSPRVLLARVKALLRRAPSEQAEVTKPEAPQRYESGGLVIDNQTRTVTMHGEPVSLNTPEYETLWYLANNEGSILSRADIFEAVRGFEYDGMSRFVDITISYLRNKLGDDPINPQRIKTVRNRGYLFSPQ